MQRQAYGCLVVLLVSVAFRLTGLMNPWIHSDTNDFLRAIHFLSSEFTGAEAPFRLQYPMYPLLSILMGPLLGSFVPGVLMPAVVFIAAFLAFDEMRAALLTGMTLASSPHLIHYSGVPLYDSLFLFMTAVVVLCLVRLAKNPSDVNAAISGACCGLAWATRGQGILYLLPIGIVLWMIGRPRVWHLAGITLLGFLVFGAMPKVSMVLLAKHRGMEIEHRACMKQLIEDGILYSKGIEYRNLVTYAADYPNPCEMTWGEFAAKHQHAYPRAVLSNGSRMLYGEVAYALNPFIVIALPLCFGVMVMFVRNRVLLAALGSMAAGIVMAAAVIQLQDRYLFPLTVVLGMVIGLGLSSLWDRSKIGFGVVFGFILLSGLHLSYLSFR